LENYNEEKIKGCYYNNNVLGICFDVQQHSMRLLKATGENTFVDHDLYPNSFFFKALDQASLGTGIKKLNRSTFSHFKFNFEMVVLQTSG